MGLDFVHSGWMLGVLMDPVLWEEDSTRDPPSGYGRRNYVSRNLSKGTYLIVVTDLYGRQEAYRLFVER